VGVGTGGRLPPFGGLRAALSSVEGPGVGRWTWDFGRWSVVMTCAWCDKNLENKDAQNHNHLLFHLQCMKKYEEYLQRIRRETDRDLRR
jgi:hypothetical protein